MKEIVIIDTSVVLAVLLGEPQKSRLERITKGVDLVAPSSLKWEFGNALSAMFKRKLLTMRESERVLQAFYQVPIQYVDIDISSALKVCEEHGLYAYDAYMIICAQKRSGALLTLDAGLRNAAKKCLVKILEV